MFISLGRLPAAGLLAAPLATLILSAAALAQAPVDPNAPDKKPEPMLKVYALKNITAQEIIVANGLRLPPPGNQLRSVRLAQNDRGKTLFVRGSAEEVAQIDELIKFLDVAPDKLVKGDAAGLYLIPLAHVEARTLLNLLTQLGLRAGVLQVGKHGSIVVLDPDSRKDIEAVVASEEATAAEKSSEAENK